MRRLPHQGARHSTVDHGDASDGVFLLLHLWVLPSSRAILLANDLPPLLSRLWMASRANGSLPCKWRHLQQLRVEGSSGARIGGGGRTDPRNGPGRAAWADWPRPISVRFGRPFTPVSPHVFMHFAPSTCTILTMSSSRPRWRFSLHEVRSFTLQSWGMFLITLRSLPPLGVISSSS
jgi:hypothetical protein